MSVIIPQVKEYQTLFWVPMLFQTASSAESVVDEMLDMITAFHDNDQTPLMRPSVVMKGAQTTRRQQILGDMQDAVAATTTIDVVPKSENTKYVILSVLKSHFLFSQLHDYELDDVIDAMQEYFCSEGDIIIQEGDSGDMFYVLEEGSCEIYIGGELIGSIQEHASFGDLALMYNSPRAATIKATTNCSLWTLDRVFFRQAMVTSSSNQNVQLCKFLSRISLFENLGSQSLNQLARSLMKQSYEDGQYIIRQGEIGEHFFVICKGTVRCTRTGDNGEENELVQLHEGDFFGERALIKKEPRAANVIAKGDAECYYLDRNNFNLMLGGLIDRLNQINEFRVLRGASVLNGLSDRRLKVLRKLLNKYTLMQGQVLLCEGSNSVYVILEGQLQNAKGDIYSVGDVTGTIDPETDTIESEGDLTTVSEEAVVMSIHKQTLLEHLQSQARDAVDGEKEDDSGRRNSMDVNSLKRDSILMRGVASTSVLKPPQNKTFIKSTLEDFKVSCLLGKGTFGHVYLATEKNSSKRVALKCLDKDALVKSGQHPYVRREAIALQHFSHPFIVEYFGVLTTPVKVVFLLEYIPGLELWTYLYQYKGMLKGPYGGIDMVSVSTFAGSILLALEHIHSQGYAYRDLKPENIIIGVDGFIKVVDFGFAKPVPFMSKSNELQYRTFTLCGTPDYMAPEVVLTQGHDSAADFWAYGVIIYELMCGHTPFSGKNQQRTFEKIVHSQKHLRFPQKFDSHGKSLIRRLLHPNASLRIGCLQNGFNDVRDHAFFLTQNVNFDKLMSKEVDVAFRPTADDVMIQSSNNSNYPAFDVTAEMMIPPSEMHENFFDGLSNTLYADDDEDE
mmetsp:Transcript_3868/g.6037  ORF Transcript_3868/g.6037 Transcript_3868/m.6037 type:complete len:844 (+) Transcript_3868:161-2692(+)|eukprot:CAMPEP_0185031220 /NCGR_PEP_ID=MMETSP1103-20130426/18565_1 /TAXON_ID=36769 /ORGANISM="Paraphysomonas bandaiensis, Strain Caron Lab Isolate" /LENGTH=843 /DNA_ID=CAMNT_0027566669 /DNA_START=92 /DNA_END=2623 /DNA_ORIENTATION=+